MRRGCEARWPIEARKTLPPKGPRQSALPPSTVPPIFPASIAPSTSPTAGSLTLNFSLDFALSLSFPSFPSPFSHQISTRCLVLLFVVVIMFV